MTTPTPDQQWKLGDEFLPFHPQASHVPPDFRDGWNRCYEAAFKATAVPPRLQALALATEDLCTIVGRKPDGTEHVLGHGPMQPKMKARELLRSYGFDDPDNEDSESGYAMAAIEDLLTWMLKVGWKAPPLVTITDSKEGD
jgi:hypothetical protein